MKNNINVCTKNRQANQLYLQILKKENRMKRLVFLMCIFLSFSALYCADGFANGTGTENDPYQITTSTELNIVRNFLGEGNNGKYFKLMNDIDLTGFLTESGGAFWLPIGDYSNPFFGKFDGNNKKITGLKINRPGTDNVGLFGYIIGGEIKNLRVEIDPDGSVSGQDNVGGLVGYIYTCIIINCYTTGSVNGRNNIGGLIGHNESGPITNSYATGSVSGIGNNIGGLVGINYRSTISNSYATSSVSGSGESIGGLVGGNFQTTISNAYATGSVSGSGKVGGLVGTNNGENYESQNYTITNSYATGSVSGYYMIGGLVGSNLSSTIANCFWNVETDGIAENVSGADNFGATGKTTEEMTNASTTDNIYLLAGWDFAGETTNGTDDIWNIGNGRNNGYPYHNLQYPGDNATLPVTLSSFTAIYTFSNTVSVMWTTQSESNMIGYHILRAETDELREALRVSDNMVRSLNQSTETNYSYTDETTFEDTKYFYWLQSAEYDGTMEFFGPVSVKTGIISNDTPVIPLITQLNNAYPNPFNPSTTISFDIAETAFVNIEIYNIRGQRVKSLVTQEIKPGRYNVVWQGKNDNNRTVSSGIYFYKMQAGKYTKINKVLMMK